MNDLTLKQLTVTVLRETKIPMTVKDIWTYAYDSTKIDTKRFQGKTPWHTIGAIIYDSIKAKGEGSEFVKISGRPVRFGLKNIDYNQNPESVKGLSLRKFYSIIIHFIE